MKNLEMENSITAEDMLHISKRKRISQMVLSTKSSPEALVESLRVSPVQQVATELAHEIKEYSFGLQKSFCEPQDLQYQWTGSMKTCHHSLG